MKYDFEYIESFLSDSNWYWGLVILGMILIVIGYIYYQSYNYQDKNGESSWKIFKNSDGFKTKVGIAAALGFLVAAELFLRIYSKFEKGRYKVLLREIHQMVATDTNRKTDEGVKFIVRTQVTTVRKPLMSVSKVCDDDNTVAFHKNGGYIEHNVTKERTHFKRIGNVYVLRLKLIDDQAISASRIASPLKSESAHTSAGPTCAWSTVGL